MTHPLANWSSKNKELVGTNSASRPHHLHKIHSQRQYCQKTPCIQQFTKPTSLNNEKFRFKTALRRFSNTQGLLSFEEFLTFKRTQIISCLQWILYNIWILHAKCTLGTCISHSIVTLTKFCIYGMHMYRNSDTVTVSSHSRRQQLYSNTFILIIVE